MGNLDHFGNNDNVVHLAVFSAPWKGEIKDLIIYHKNEIKKTVFLMFFFIIKFLLLSQKILPIITAIVCLIKSLGNLSSSFQIKGKNNCQEFLCSFIIKCVHVWDVYKMRQKMNIKRVVANKIINSGMIRRV